MRIFSYPSFGRFYKHLPSEIQKKIDRQILMLEENFRHPSLQVKKIRGTKNVWEARVDLHYRMSFEILHGAIYLRVVGNHDDVLKNP